MSRTGRCVVIGAGRIGIGFVAERLRAAGLGVTVVTRTVERAEAINRHGGARVRLLTRAGAHDVRVGPLEAVPAEDAATVTRRIAQAPLVAVSVGSAQLYAVAPIIAPGLTAHPGTVNVLAFENERDAGARLRAHIAAVADGPVDRHGFAGALVDRIVTSPDDADEGPLRLVAESRIRAVVDAQLLRGRLPRVAGLRPVRDYDAHVLRKLHVFSAGHAAAAYLGALRGHRLLTRALEDPEVRAGVLAAMAEGQAGLAARHGRFFPGGPERRLAEFARFGNAALGDTVDRVGRDPIRKLGVEDRISGPGLLAAGAGIAPVGLAVVAAAAVRVAVQDPAVSRSLLEHGVPGLLQRHAGVPADSSFARLVGRAWELLSGSGSLTAVRSALLADADDPLLQAS